MDTPEYAFPYQLDGSYAGVTLRDYFAARCLQAAIARGELGRAIQGFTATHVEDPEGDAKVAIADACYEMADAMLVAREKKPSINSDQGDGASGGE